MAHLYGPTRSLGVLVTVAMTCLGVSASAAQTHALCIENGTDKRLFFAVRAKGAETKGLLFRQWLDSAARVCPKLSHKSDVWEVFVFSDEDSIEGCDDEVGEGDTLGLHKFEEFDNCVWDHAD